jgi:hypothetical protein
MNYFSASFLIFPIVSSSFMIIMVYVTFFGTDMSFIIKIIAVFIPEWSSGTFSAGIPDVMKIFFILSLPVYITKKIYGFINKPIKLPLGAYLIAFLHLLAIVSLPFIKTSFSRISFIPIILLFLVISLFFYFLYYSIQKIIDKIKENIPN